MRRSPRRPSRSRRRGEIGCGESLGTSSVGAGSSVVALLLVVMAGHAVAVAAHLAPGAAAGAVRWRIAGTFEDGGAGSGHGRGRGPSALTGAGVGITWGRR